MLYGPNSWLCDEVFKFLDLISYNLVFVWKENSFNLSAAAFSSILYSYSLFLDLDYVVGIFELYKRASRLGSCNPLHFLIDSIFFKYFFFIGINWWNDHGLIRETFEYKKSVRVPCSYECSWKGAKVSPFPQTKPSSSPGESPGDKEK